jgi:uncharacterized protein with HEPN domain
MTQLQLLRLKDYLNHMIQAIEQVAQYLADVSEDQLNLQRQTPVFHGRRFTT